MLLMRLEKILRQPGIEPGTTAWKAAMLTITPLTPLHHLTQESIFQVFLNGMDLPRMVKNMFFKESKIGISPVHYGCKNLRKNVCVNRESNPEQQLGRLLC